MAARVSNSKAEATRDRIFSPITWHRRGNTVVSLLGLFVVLAGSIVYACDFHVDAERGDDSRDGMKPETAWCSLARVNRAILVPGDRVLFRRGQAWRGQLIPQSGSADGVIYYPCYNRDAVQPVILPPAF